MLVSFGVKKLINGWADHNFQSLQALDSLYRYQLDCIFTGRQPHNTAILSNSSLSDFYEDLSELMDKSYTSLTVRPL
jgi:hypothetical protein